MNLFGALLKDNLRESMQKRTFWVMLAISLMVATSLASIALEEDGFSYGFGLGKASYQQFLMGQDSRAIGGLLIYTVNELFLNTIGLLLMLAGTAAMIPDFLQDGRIEVLLAKPISRFRLFLYKYASCMIFVAIQATIFVGLIFLVAGFRWGTWMPRFLIAIPLSVLLFSYIFCVTALVGTKTRSTMASILLTAVALFAFSVPQQTDQALEATGAYESAPAVRPFVKTITWIFPKTVDTTYMAARFIGAGLSIDGYDDADLEGSGMDRGKLAAVEEQRYNANPYLSIGSSLLFEAVLVAMAAWIFIRRDY